ncbi:V-type ATP synthase subunit B [Betaproteobacteria bacterium SCN2]|jgi:V/A-type H+-transporting ATPase subunit B|nr:V-type ATP synthase subunit B [Betaproteobacteria bacterium SCN2]
MSMLEYSSAAWARGGLLAMRSVPEAALGDRVVVRDHTGRSRSGQVIRTSADLVLVQIFEGTDNLDLERTWVRFLDKPFELALAPEVLGRVFNGVGQPRDGRPPIVARLSRNVNGASINPAARAYPREFIQTGISTIDGMNTLVRGQKLPVFSGSGLPHNRLAAQIVRQAKLLHAGKAESHGDFALVFAAMGVSHSDARFFEESFEESGVLGQVATFINLADDPPIERLILPRVALTCAEYLAFDLDMHVLVVMTDMTYYAEALREIATGKGDVPARKGFPGYLYSDLAEIYERAGRIRGKAGSITLIPVVSMPSDDITHPVPDLTGYITEGQIVLSRELAAANVQPPVAVLPSLSRLMKDGIGEGMTREDHARVASQLFASYAKAQEVRSLAAIIGAEELSEEDNRYLQFAEAFENRFVSQGEREDRSIFQTLDLAWEVLSLLPKEALTRLSEKDLDARYRQAAAE